MQQGRNSNQKRSRSELKENDIGILKGKKFIVENRYPEDRASGISEIIYLDSKGRRTFVWDSENPEVEYIGQGKIETIITMETK